MCHRKVVNFSRFWTLLFSSPTKQSWTFRNVDGTRKNFIHLDWSDLYFPVPDTRTQTKKNFYIQFFWTSKAASFTFSRNFSSLFQCFVSTSKNHYFLRLSFSFFITWRNNRTAQQDELTLLFYFVCDVCGGGSEESEN